MGLFKKKGNDNTEIVEGLKSLVERVNDFLTSRIGIDKEHKALFTQAIKAEVEKDFRIPFDDFMLGVKNNEFQISYWGPLSAATIFLYTTDVNKLHKDNELPAILNNPLPELANWEEVFNNLLLLPSSMLNFYVARMDCTNKAKKIILDALLKSDFASFEKCVENMGSESDLLKNVADWYKVVWGIYSVFTEGAENKNQEIIANDSLNSMEEEDGDSCRTITDLAESLPVSEEGFTPEIISKTNYENMKSLYLLNMNLYLKSRTDYLKERDSYPKEIQDIVDPYVVDPEEIEFYVELKKRGCTFDTIKDNVVNKQETIIKDDLEPNTDIFLPNDFFYIQNRNSDKSIGILKIGYTECNEAVNRFCELINHLAKHGFIGDNQETKRNFAYKLSGYYIKYNTTPVEWHGETNILSVLISRMVESGQKWQNAKEAFVFDKDVRLYNSSSLRKNNSYDMKFAELFKRLYEIDLYK